jgi:hypothetical protein
MVTGSVVKDVFAKARVAGAGVRVDLMIELCLDRTNKTIPADGYKSPAMIWGTETEPAARMAYEMSTGRDVEESGFIYLADGTKAGCSVDGFVWDGSRKGIVEFKCPESKTHWGYLLGGVAPANYIPQMVHNMWITGADFCDFMSFDPRFDPAIQQFHIRVERNESAIQVHAAGVLQFLMELDAEETKMRAFIEKRRAGIPEFV